MSAKTRSRSPCAFEQKGRKYEGARYRCKYLRSALDYLMALLPWLYRIDALLTWLFTMLLPYELRTIPKRRAFFAEVFSDLFVRTSFPGDLSVFAVTQEVLHGLDSVAALLATNLPKASKYFFPYLFLRYFLISVSPLLQSIGVLSPHP